MKHASKGIHPGFETQGRHHQKYKTGVSVALQKGEMSSKIFLKNCAFRENAKNLIIVANPHRIIESQQIASRAKEMKTARHRRKN